MSFKSSLISCVYPANFKFLFSSKNYAVIFPFRGLVKHSVFVYLFKYMKKYFSLQSLLSEKTKVVIEGENTIQELQDIIQQKDVMIKRIQNQLEEALESKENELLQLRDALESRQRDLEAKQRDLEEAHEELFR